MKYLNRIRPFYFFFAFMLGLLYVYLIQPGLKYIIRHPTPENAGQITYQNVSNSNKQNECFVYRVDKVECPVDKSLINQHPITVAE
jgi:hypothetical protein